MQHTLQTLLESIYREDYGEFSQKVHTICNQREIDLELISQLLISLQTMLSEYNSSDDMEDYSYLKFSQAIPLCAYFVLAEIRRQIAAGTVLQAGDKLLQGSHSLRLPALTEALQGAAEQENDEPEILWLMEEVLSGEMNPLQQALLDHYCESAGFTILHMIFWLREIETPEELRQKESAGPNRRTHADWVEECARKHHTSYCYFFLEQASSAESGRMAAALNKLEKTRTPREFVLAVAEADACLDHWTRNAAVFPYTTYRYLTDDRFETSFRDGTACV